MSCGAQLGHWLPVAGDDEAFAGRDSIDHLSVVIAQLSLGQDLRHPAYRSKVDYDMLQTPVLPCHVKAGRRRSPDERNQPLRPLAVGDVSGKVAAQQGLLGPDPPVVRNAQQRANHLDDREAARR